MRIAIEVAFNQGGYRGGDVYTYGLIKALAAIDAENEYFLFGYVFHDHQLWEQSVPCPDQRNFQRLIKRWPQVLVKRIERKWNLPLIESCLERHRIDVYHSPGPALPRLRHIKSVVSIHDLTLLAHPEFVPSERLPVWRPECLRAIDMATRVIASSHLIKDYVTRTLHQPEEKTHAVDLGIDHDVFFEIKDMARLAAVKKKYALPPQFVIATGPYETRRNWEGLLQAVSKIQKGGTPLGVVLTGGIAPEYKKSVNKLIEDLQLHAVVQTGYVPLEDMVSLYNLATAFVYPAFYDSCSLTLIEAMACGAPAIASAVGGLPEVAGGAALLIPSVDPDVITESMLRVMDPDVRTSFRAKGLQRARQFSWDKAARATLAIYREAFLSQT